MNKYHLFETDRLWIRPTTEEDAAFILAIFNSPKALRFIGDRKIRTSDDALAFIRNRTLKQFTEIGYGNYTIVTKGEGAKVGVCGLYNRPGLKLVDIGYALLPEQEGNGYALEASRAVQQAAKEVFGLNKLCAITHPENEASSRLLVKLGLKKIDQRHLPGVEGLSDYYES
jgi:RimJ/RimL family protein N-acetyltransferase